MTRTGFNEFCAKWTPEGFTYVPCQVVIESVRCLVRRNKGVKKKAMRPIYHALVAALEGAGFKISWRDCDEQKGEITIWCPGSQLEKDRPYDQT